MAAIAGKDMMSASSNYENPVPLFVTKNCLFMNSKVSLVNLSQTGLAYGGSQDRVRKLAFIHNCPTFSSLLVAAKSSCM